jgi:hypothetical protein
MVNETQLHRAAQDPCRLLTAADTAVAALSRHILCFHRFLQRLCQLPQAGHFTWRSPAVALFPGPGAGSQNPSAAEAAGSVRLQPPLSLQPPVSGQPLQPRQPAGNNANCYGPPLLHLSPSATPRQVRGGFHSHLRTSCRHSSLRTCFPSGVGSFPQNCCTTFSCSFKLWQRPARSVLCVVDVGRGGPERQVAPSSLLPWIGCLHGRS